MPVTSRGGQRAAALAGTAVALASLGLGGAPPAAAATITVTTTADAPAGAAADGLCSLREAVRAAETDQAVDGCPAGVKRDVVVLPLPSTDYVVDQGTLEMKTWVTLRGPGVVRGNNPDGLPTFSVRLSGRVHLDGLTLTGDSPAIANRGTLLLSSVTLRDIGAKPGGQAAPALDSDGVAYLDSTSILSNRGAPGGFGAVHNGPHGRMQIERTVISGNSADEAGSTADPRVTDMAPAVGNEGRLFVRKTTLQSNGGAAIDSTNSLTVYESSLVGNQVGLRNSGSAALLWAPVTGNGRGIVNSGWLSYSTATIADNSGWAGYPSAGGIDTTGTLQLREAAVVRNSGIGTGGVRSAGTSSLANVTLAANTATAPTTVTDPAPVGAGGLTVAAGTTTLTNVTVADNRSTTVPGPAGGQEAGNLAVLAGTATLADSVLAGGVLSPAAAGGRDCTGTVLSAGYNLVAHPAGCDFRIAPGDILGAGALLLPLGDNGGRRPTLTLLPAADSPLVDHGSPAPAGASGACLSSDQRERPRPVDGDGDGEARCDIGAVERQAVAGG